MLGVSLEARTLLSMKVSFSVQDILQIVQAPAVRGTSSRTLVSIASLEAAVPGEISFLGSAKYKAQVPLSKASLLLLPSDYAEEPQPDQVYLLVKNPSAALAAICARIEQTLWPKPKPGIHPTAVIGEGTCIDISATIGPLCIVEDGAVIGPRTHLQGRVFIGREAVIGADCWFMPGVTVSAQCEVRDRVRLHPGVVIGGDGFGYEFVNGRHEKVPQVGNVIIENDVEIGSNSTVDRARFSHTIVGEGSKIDNLVQLGHNVVVGKHCILCSQVGVSGSTTLEDYVVLAGQAGIAGHITLGRGSKVGGQSGISASLAPGSYVTGTPHLPFQRDRRINVLRERLPDLFRRVDALESRTPPSVEPTTPE